MLKDLTPEQTDLESLMSDLSEEAYSAGWMQDLEYELWEIVHSEKSEYGRLIVTDEIKTHLKVLSQKCGGWIFFDDEKEECFASLCDWEIMFRNWKLKQT